MLGFNVSLTLFQPYCDGTCMRQVIESAATLEHSCCRHLTGAPQPVTLSADTGLASYVPQHSPFNAKCKQGNYWYHLFTTFGMSRLGIKSATFRIPSGLSTTYTRLTFATATVRPPQKMIWEITCRP